MGAHKPRVSEPRKERRRRDVVGSILATARSNAKRGGFACTISRADIVVPRYCPALGIPLRKAHGRMNDNSPSIDRLDPDQGYTPDNISIISWKANRIKSDATLMELVALVAWLRLAQR